MQIFRIYKISDDIWMAECSIYNSDSIYDSFTYVGTYLITRKSDSEFNVIYWPS